nr:putative late blight resistance protein homolog R1A-3 [Ipomoea trifida]
MVLERRADSQIKTCRIHDTLHEFCKIEAARKNLFHEMEGAKRGEVIKDKNANRLCVNSSIMEFLESIGKSSSGEHVRSFLSSCSKEIEVPNHCLSAIPKSFPLLRVIDVENLKFKVLPKQFYELYHLRFIAVSTELKILPKLFSNFHNMETILFNTTQKSLEVKAEIWSMQKLRHVHTNTSMQLPLPPNTSRNNRVGSTEIKTLSTISPSSCTSEILDMTPDLQKLGIRGNLVELMESKGGVCLFDNIQKLDRLENLKLIHDALQGNKLRSFPRADKFPRRLRKMTLSNTAFDWMDFNTLGLLYELEVLKLEDNAFRGELCHVSNDVVFRQLHYLRIERVDIVSWTVSKQSFPVLKYLFLRNCTKLDAVPPAFDSNETTQNGECKDFTCGFLGILGFPFSESSRPDCGLIKLDCAANNSRPKLDLVGKKYEVVEKDANFLRVVDRDLERLLGNSSCETFYKNLSLPDSPVISYDVYHFLTLFRCDLGSDKSGLGDLGSYNKCSGFEVFYKENPYEDLVNYGYVVDRDTPAGCSRIELAIPLSTDIKPNGEGPFGLLNSSFLLEWGVSGDCNDCRDRGGRCIVDENNRYRCSTGAYQNEILV